VLKLFFATDVHGSETTFRKWLNAAQHYGADVLLMGGDLTGKMLVPIVQERDGSYTARFEGAEVRVDDQRGLADLERALRQRGYYTQRMTAEERARYQTPEQVEELFRKHMAEVLEGWVGLADERLDRDRQVEFLGEDPGGLQGPAVRAREQPADSLTAQERGCRPRLGRTALGERRIGQAGVDPARPEPAVPLGFGVAQEEHLNDPENPPRHRPSRPRRRAVCFCSPRLI